MSTVSKYSEGDIKAALITYWLEGENAKRAAQHIDVPPTTIERWAKKSHKELYDDLIEKNRPLLTKTLLRRMEAIQFKAYDLIERLLDDTGRQLDEGTIKNPAQAAQQIATILGIVTDKWRLIQELPTQITGTTDAGEHLKALKARFPWLIHDSTAEEISEPPELNA